MAGDFGLGSLQIITLSSGILSQRGVNRIHMVDLESNIQMWRALGTKPRSLTGAVHMLGLGLAGPACWLAVRKGLTLIQTVEGV